MAAQHSRQLLDPRRRTESIELAGNLVLALYLGDPVVIIGAGRHLG